MCVLISATSFVRKFLILRRTERDMIKMSMVFMKNVRYSCLILMKLEFSGQFFEKYSNFMKIRSVGVELLHADRRTDGQT